MDAHHVISTILRHDRKQNSYKIALLRSIGDVALSFPDVQQSGRDVALPLRMLAEYWVAYYWPFADPEAPLLQGARARLGGERRQDMAFRIELEQLRREWERITGYAAPSDGFLLIHELRIPRRRRSLPVELIKAYESAIRKIATAIRQPIQYAGPGQWEVFERPRLLAKVSRPVKPIPGTSSREACLIVSAELWRTINELSLWVEALCIHEWCLFSETVRQEDGTTPGRGEVYTLLTDRPDNRRPLTWEHNQIDLLLLEGQVFRCPWTERPIDRAGSYDLDHLLPVTVYPVNELWNLVPADPRFNQHVKRERIPTRNRLQNALPLLAEVYEKYLLSPTLAQAVRDDVNIRFADLGATGRFTMDVAGAAVRFIDQIASVRNIARF